MKELSKEVIADFKKGKRAAFDHVYAAFSPWLYGICLRYTRCDSDAQDVLQDSFIQIYESKERFDKQLPIGPWLKTITIRMALNYVRMNYKYIPLDDHDIEGLEEEFIFEEHEFISTNRELLLKALQALPDGYRMIFNLYIVDNLSHSEISMHLGISEGTSKSQFFKAKKKLKELLSINIVSHE